VGFTSTLTRADYVKNVARVAAPVQCVQITLSAIRIKVQTLSLCYHMLIYENTIRSSAETLNQISSYFIWYECP